MDNVDEQAAVAAAIVRKMIAAHKRAKPVEQRKIERGLRKVYKVMMNKSGIAKLDEDSHMRIIL